MRAELVGLLVEAPVTPHQLAAATAPLADARQLDTAALHHGTAWHVTSETRNASEHAMIATTTTCAIVERLGQGSNGQITPGTP